DAHHAVFQGLGDTPDATDIARVEIRGEAELGGVGKRNRLLLVLEAIERSNRTERFLARDEHFGGDAFQHGRLEEGSAKCVAMPANDNTGPVIDSILDVLLDLLDRGHVDQRTLYDARSGTIANLQPGDLRGELP